MKRSGQLLGLIAGVGLGAAAAVSLVRPEPAAAGSNDRIQDYVMATGAVSLNPRQQSDGVWLLDYRSGKLLGTVIDRNIGKIVGWAEVDLVAEFEVAPDLQPLRLSCRPQPLRQFRARPPHRWHRHRADRTVDRRSLPRPAG